MEMTTSSSTSSQGPPEAAAVPVAAIAGGVVGGLAAAFLLIIIALLLLFIIKSRTEAHIGIYAQSPRYHKSKAVYYNNFLAVAVLAARNAQDSDYHDYDEADYDTVIETKECATYAIQKKADLESNPAYIIYAEVGGDEVATVEMRECAAYGTQEAVATKDLEANPAYQAVTTGYEMKECPAYGTQERVVTDVNPAYQTVTAYS